MWMNCLKINMTEFRSRSSNFHKGEVKEIEWNPDEWDHVATGGFGVVYKKKSADIALKLPKHASINLKKEGDILQSLQSIPYFPRLYAYTENEIYFEYIDGMLLSDWLSEGNKLTEAMLQQLYDAYEQSLKCGIRPVELEPDHVIWNDSEIRIIDVGMYLEIVPVKEETLLEYEREQFEKHFMKWADFWTSRKVNHD